MNIISLNDKKKIFWILQISGWSLLALFNFAIYYRSHFGEPAKAAAVFITYFIGFFISLLLRRLYRKIDYTGRSIQSLSGIVIVGSILAANLQFFIDAVLSIPLHEKGWINTFLTVQVYLSQIFWKSFILGTWSALYFAVNLWIEWNLQQGRIEKANALAHAAQLQMLRYQLNPHFLFNALNSIRALVDENQKHAKDMITELSEFLRYSLVSKNYSDVPLKQELEAVQHYFRIEKKRYEEKLQIEYDIDPLAEEYPVLSFLIHPLVENAVKYGMQTSPMPLVIKLQAKVVEESLHLEICNSGRWTEPEGPGGNGPKGTGTGLENIRRRLENAFPGCHTFETVKGKNQVCIRLIISKGLNQAAPMP